MSFGALLFTFGAVTSVATTYAWYSLKVSSTVNNLNIAIKMDDINFELWLKDQHGEKIHEPEGYTKEQLGIEDIKLADVSGMFESTWYNRESKTATTTFPQLRTSYGRNRSSTKDTGIEKEKYFVQNEFYFRSNYDAIVYLDPSSFIRPNIEENAKQKDKDVNKLNEVSNTVRVSFFTDEGYIIAHAKEYVDETYYGGVLNITSDDNYYDYNLDSKEEILYGEYSDDIDYSKLYGAPVEEETDIPEDKRSTFVASHKKGIRPVDLDYAKTKIVKENAVRLSSLMFDRDDPLAATPICTVQKGVEKRIVISTYVEGWDLKMTNDIDSACFDINISFLALVS